MNTLQSIFILFLYFVPSFIALYRHHRNMWPVIIVNLTTAWIPFMWIACLVWASWNSKCNCNEE